MLNRKSFSLDREGGVAPVFALSLLAASMAIAAAIETSSIYKQSAQAKSAADSAALAAVNASMITDNQTDAQKIAAMRAAATNAFKAALAPGLTIASADASPVFDGKRWVVTFNYKVKAVSFFSQLLPWDGLLSGSVQAVASGGVGYIDIYILVDTSQSMGLGADLTDQKGMMEKVMIPDDSQPGQMKASGCALACHNDDPKQDTVLKARAAGFKLRIDVIKDAIKNVVSDAQSTMSSTGAKIRIGLYTFDNNFHVMTEPTSEMNAVQSAANNLDIAHYYAGTSTYYGLTELRKKIAATGDGTRQSAPKTFVMLMTDGTVNAVENRTTTNWEMSATAYPTPSYSNICYADKPPVVPPSIVGLPEEKQPKPYFYPPGEMARSVPCVPDPWYEGKDKRGVEGTHSGNGQMEMQPIDPAWCQPLKSAGATVMTLYTQYVLLPKSSTDPNDWTTNDWRIPFLETQVIPKLQPNMQACASSADNAFSAADSAAIHAGTKAMFSKAVATLPRLTK